MRARLDWPLGMPSLLIRGNVVVGDAVRPGWVALRDGVVAGVGDGPVPGGFGAPVELGDLLIAPGFVDVHVHGGGGGQVAGDDRADVADQLLRAARFHASHGTTCLVATTVSDTVQRLRATAEGVRIAMGAAAHNGAVIAGLHLEGPWLAPSRCGAHDPCTLRLPDLVELADLIDAAGGAVRLLTLAPELPGADALIAAATARGVLVSVGHTEATYAQTYAAFDAGARHLTHLGNAMRGIDRHEPGPIAAALADERVTVEVIADGHHVHPALLRLAAGAAPGRVVAITDAIAATGLPDGAHRVGRLPVRVHAGRVALADRPQTLAGSVLTMDRAVAGLIAAGIDPVEAIRAATATPARLLAVPAAEPRRGVLATGARADLVVLDGGYTAQATVIGGDVVHDPAGLLAR
jgi:N-acetylglucosamine-6-phosphate deacetylase